MGIIYQSAVDGRTSYATSSQIETGIQLTCNALDMDVRLRVRVCLLASLRVVSSTCAGLCLSVWYQGPAEHGHTRTDTRMHARKPPQTRAQTHKDAHTHSNATRAHVLRSRGHA